MIRVTAHSPYLSENLSHFREHGNGILENIAHDADTLRIQIRIGVFDIVIIILRRECDPADRGGLDPDAGECVGIACPG